MLMRVNLRKFYVTSEISRILCIIFSKWQEKKTYVPAPGGRVWIICLCIYTLIIYILALLFSFYTLPELWV